jgi:hypothetical protein
MDLKADIAESTTTGLKTGIDDTTGFNSPKLLQIYSRYLESTRTFSLAI